MSKQWVGELSTDGFCMVDRYRQFIQGGVTPSDAYCMARRWDLVTDSYRTEFREAVRRNSAIYKQVWFCEFASKMCDLLCRMGDNDPLFKKLNEKYGGING